MSDFLRSIVGIWLCFIGLIPLAAQPDTCLIRSITANVEGPDGLPVTNLQASDFRGTLRGNAITVVSSVYERFPRRLLILLDVSDSVTNSNREWIDVLESVKSFVASLPPQVTPALMIFADGAQLVSPFDDGRRELMAKLAGLAAVRSKSVNKFAGRTSIFDAIAHGLSFLGPPQTGDTFFLVTDGYDNASVEKEPDAQRGLLQSGIRIFGMVSFQPTIQSAVPYPVTYRESRHVPNVFDIAGGYAPVFHWARHGKLWDEFQKRLYSELARMIRNIGESYRLELKLERPINDFSRWKLSVTNGHPERKSFHILYPQRLAPCN